MVEDFFGVTLPKSYREFVNSYDGATPETNIFRRSEKENGLVGVSRFIPLKDVLEERKNVEPIPPRLLPIAHAEGGNYVLIDIDSSAISFWDHENGMSTEIAANFDEFLEYLVPFKVQLKPGQVKRVWIDPSFRADL